MYVHVHSPNSELFGLHVEVVAQLAFLGEEICVVAVVEPQLVLGERAEELGLSPVDIPQISHRVGLDPEHSASPKQEDLIGEIHEIPPIPGPRAEHKGREVQEEGVPIPEQLQGVEHVVEHR